MNVLQILYCRGVQLVFRLAQPFLPYRSPKLLHQVIYRAPGTSTVSITFSKNQDKSMLQDLEKGRKCEIDAINGVVCAYGRKYGVKTPYNDKVCEIVHGIEDGKYTYCFDNVKLFDSLK